MSYYHSSALKDIPVGPINRILVNPLRTFRDGWKDSVALYVVDEKLVDEIALQGESCVSALQKALKNAADNHYWGTCEELERFALFSKKIAEIERELLSARRMAR